MKLWEKGYVLNKEIERFTVGNDYLLDRKLVKFDCLASMAHARMLKEIGVLTEEELKKLVEGLNEIMELDQKGEFEIKLEDEDCHTAIENYLIHKYGEAGKKIHTARSRNDQVLTAIRLFEKFEINKIKELLEGLKEALNRKIKVYSNVKMPGHTHMQKAMPMNVKDWLGSFVDSTQDNLALLEGALRLIDQSPLGSAAGFGVPVLDINRQMTADDMGFAKVMENPVYVQMSRGKFESTILHVLTQVMFDLNKLATDLMIFSTQEFDYVSLPVEFCTGSSIMPQKKNPDVLELVRAKYHIVLGEEFKIKNTIGNLMSGYNRDVQLTKEPLLNAMDITQNCLGIMTLMVSGIELNVENCKNAMSKDMFATEEVYRLVADGMPFREAYKAVAKKLS